MSNPLEFKGLVLGIVSGMAAVGVAFAAGKVLQSGPSAAVVADESSGIPPSGAQARLGYELFQRNCAHCHGTDARGDEGPDLHGITKSDPRLTKVIQNGIKGEMPRFGAKLKDSDTRALVVFIRSLKEE